MRILHSPICSFGFVSSLRLLVCLAVLLPCLNVISDEGMYLFNELPTQQLKSRHDFVPSQQWADSLRLSSVRFNSGGSGSFISSDGLVLTNHHVASDTLHKLSTPERNLIEDGFLAKTIGDELQAPDLELNQLVSIDNVTDRINAAVTSKDDPEKAATQRRAIVAEIEQESTEKTGLRSDVVTLYGGAQSHLYRYKKYTDVRLVWAPETAAAFFGGDADNFEYPRFCMDATIMRVYENGKPAKLKNFLRWSDKPVSDGQLVFVSGNPGRTQRIYTVDALKYLRDHRMPYVLNYLRRKEVLLQQFGLGGEEDARRARDGLFGIQNGRKAYTGMLAGLQSPQTIAAKQEQQDKVLASLNAQDATSLRAAFAEIAEVQQARAKLLKQSVTFRSRYFDLALSILLLAKEDEKPNQDRLSEFTDAGRDSLLQDLLSTAPIYRDLERVKLADELARFVEARGGDDPLVVQTLAGKGPRERAAELIDGSELGDVDRRKKFVESNAKTLLDSNDPVIQLAAGLEDEYRRIRKRNESLDERQRQAYATITQLTNQAMSGESYPDATFTLRLAFGLVKPYQQDGQTIPIATNFAGAFEHETRHAGQKDFKLPQSWHDAKEKLNDSTQLNFVCTADIIGGNSGSPVVNRQGELVGLIFDGNIQSLTSDYLYSDRQGRAVSVSGVGILEALRNVYDATELADSIGH
ncbi:MAG: serine protease [Rhodopirellula sp. TMED11]|nr:MAG: serine protease [Rhodopirellula sp. TMED11]